MPSPEIHGIKRLVFITILVSMSILVFCCIELVLRIFNVGSPPSLYHVVRVRGDEYIDINNNYMQRFYRSKSRAGPNPIDYFFKKDDPHEYRIFVIGESSSLGYPFPVTAAFPFQLEQMLKQTDYAEKRIRVYNFSMTAISAYIGLDMSRDLVGLHPDLAILYFGHNEFTGIGGSQFLRNPLNKLKVAMNRLFLFQTMELLIINLLQNDTPRNLFTELSTGSRIPYKGNLYDKTLTRFSQTYSRIIQTFTAAHIPVITCGVVGNEKDMPPFQSEMRIDSAQRIHLLQSIETTPHRTFSAIKNLARNDAGAFFDAARVLLRSDNLDLARQCFKEARDLDPFRVRASSDINEGIKDISRKHQCPYIDFQKEIEEIAETGVVGNRFLVEHVHPTIETHTFMARKLTELICNDILSIPFHDEYGEIEPMVSLVDLVNSCEVLLELFTDFPYKDHDYFNAHALNTIFDTNSPLFKKLYQENNIALLFERADSIAHPTINKKALRKIIDLFLKHRNLAKVHCAYGAHLMTQNQLHRAYLEYIIASKQAPGYPVPLNNMAVLAWNAGLTEESLSIFDFMNLRFPDFTQGCENYYLAAKRSGMNRAAAQLEEHLKRSGVDPTRIRHMSIVDY